LLQGGLPPPFLIHYAARIHQAHTLHGDRAQQTSLRRCSVNILHR
jgi:hypothetical protein